MSALLQDLASDFGPRRNPVSRILHENRWEKWSACSWFDSFPKRDLPRDGHGKVRQGLSRPHIALHPLYPPTLLAPIQIHTLNQPFSHLQSITRTNFNTKNRTFIHPSSFLTHLLTLNINTLAHSITIIRTTYHLNKPHPKNPSYIPTFFHSQDHSPKISTISPLI